MQGERWYSIYEIAAWAQVPVEELIRLIEAGELVGHTISDRDGYYVHEGDFELWREEITRESRGPDTRGCALNT